MDLIEKIFTTGIIIGLAVLFYVAVGHNLDKPTPHYEHGEIVAFETPDGWVYPDNPKFKKLIASYRH